MHRNIVSKYSCCEKAWYLCGLEFCMYNEKKNIDNDHVFYQDTITTSSCTFDEYAYTRKYMLFFRFLWKKLRFRNVGFFFECTFRVEFKLFPVGWMRMVMVTQKHISEFVVSAKSSIINSPRTNFFWEKVLFLLAHVYEFQIQKKILSHFLCHTETRLPIFFFWQIFVGTIFMYVLSFIFFLLFKLG